jgi:hypothetical protein
VWECIACPDEVCGAYDVADPETLFEKETPTMDHNQKPGAPAQMPYQPPTVKPVDPLVAAAVSEALKPKPGYKTTELYVTAAAGCLPYVIDAVPKSWAAVISGVVAVGYAISRGLAKFRK